MAIYRKLWRMRMASIHKQWFIVKDDHPHNDSLSGESSFRNLPGGLCTGQTNVMHASSEQNTYM